MSIKPSGHPAAHRAVAYIRASTGRQELTPGAQEKRVREYCKWQGIELAYIVSETVTSRTPFEKRDGAARLLELVRNGQVGSIVAVKLDRLFRNTREALVYSEAWDQAGVALHVLDLGLNTRSAIGKFFFTIIAAAAEMERGQISERTVEALAFKKSQKQRLGGTPLGWITRPDGSIVQEAEGQETRRLVREMREQGHSYFAIAREMQSRGRPTAKGGKWSETAVMRLVLPCYLEKIGC